MAAPTAGRRVLCLCSQGRPVTGQVEVSTAVLAHFADAGYRVSLVAKSATPGLARVARYLASLAHIAWEALRPPRPRLAYLTGSRSRGGFLRDALLLALCRLRGVPVVNHVHGADLPALLRDRWLGAPARALLGGIHANVVLSEAMAAECARAGLRNCVVIGNFAAPPLFEVSRAPRPGPPRILYLSNVARAKGIFELLAACARLRERGHAFELDIVGEVLEDSARQARRTRAALRAQLDRLDCARWAGARHGDARLAAYAAADVFCLPSHGEAAPLALLDAMAAGLPCVATAVGAVPELAQDQDSALLVPPRDAGALAAALEALLAAPALRERLGRRAREVARQRHAWPRFRQQLDRLVREAAGTS